jgi:MoxR-like ATPase
MKAQRETHPIEALSPVADLAHLASAQEAVTRVFVHDSVVRYVQRLVAETRRHPHAAWGASPRGALGLMRLAQSTAALRGERFVTPDHVKRLAESVLAHRIVVKPRSRVQGVDGARIVAESVEHVEVPIDYAPA